MAKFKATKDGESYKLTLDSSELDALRVLLSLVNYGSNCFIDSVKEAIDDKEDELELWEANPAEATVLVSLANGTSIEILGSSIEIVLQ